MSAAAIAPSPVVADATLPGMAPEEARPATRPLMPISAHEKAAASFTRLGNALRTFDVLSGPLAPLTGFLRMAYAGELPKRSEKWESAGRHPDGTPYQSGSAEWDPNSRSYLLASDVLLLMEGGGADDGKIAAKVIALHVMAQDLRPVVAAQRKYEQELKLWADALPVAMRT